MFQIEPYVNLSDRRINMIFYASDHSFTKTNTLSFYAISKVGALLANLSNCHQESQTYQGFWKSLKETDVMRITKFRRFTFFASVFHFLLGTTNIHF